MRRTFDILLVENNPAGVVITRTASRRSQAGKRIRVCRGGDNARAFPLRHGRFYNQAAAVRSDLNLLRKSDFDVLFERPRNDQRRPIPVVALTTSDGDEDVTRCYRSVTTRYLTKPVQFDECLKVVDASPRHWRHLTKLPLR